MNISLFIKATGGELGRAMAHNAEETAEALVAISSDVDHAELTGFIEQWARYADQHELTKMRQLWNTINEGLIRAEKK